MLNLRDHCHHHTAAEMITEAHAQQRTHPPTQPPTHSLEANHEGASALQSVTFNVVIQHDTAAYSLTVTLGAGNSLLAPELS